MNVERTEPREPRLQIAAAAPTLAMVGAGETCTSRVASASRSRARGKACVVLRQRTAETLRAAAEVQAFRAAMRDSIIVLWLPILWPCNGKRCLSHTCDAVNGWNGQYYTVHTPRRRSTGSCPVFRQQTLLIKIDRTDRSSKTNET